MNHANVAVNGSTGLFRGSSERTRHRDDRLLAQMGAHREQLGSCAEGAAAACPPLPDQIGINAESIREDERQRIARDIHDELGQQLLVLRIDVLRLCKRIDNAHPDLEVLVGTVRRQLDATTHSLRAVIRGLRSTVLDGGLRAAIQIQCAQFHQCFGIVYDLEWNAGDSALTDSCALVLFRALQEALTNVQRHAQASCVRITVDKGPHHIVMTIADNGIGYFLADYAKTQAFGLSGMRERITALGGQLAITSGLQEGMMLTITLPV